MAKIVFDQRKREFDAGGDTRGGPYRAIVHVDALAPHAHLRPQRLQLIAGAPVGGGLAAVEQARHGERERAAAHTGDAAYAGCDLREPGTDVLFDDRRAHARFFAARNDQRVDDCRQFLDDTDDPAVTTWVRQQAGKGARVIGICAGGLVVGRAGLLDGRRFASHWYYRNTLVERHPTGTYVPNQRYVVDRDVATTTGISASVPATLALVEAIGGRDKAQGLAAELGVPAWSPVHDSRPFYLDAGRRVSYLLSKVAFWRNEKWSVDVRDGSDDIALALAVDAWTRTGHVSVESASASGPVKLRSGLVLLAHPVAGDSPRLPLAPTLKPLQQLVRTLCEIAGRFGATRREWVMLELEYPGEKVACI